MKNLNLNIFMLQKKESLPEFIKGSYMVVLTFESACRWNTIMTIQINFFRQYFNLVRFGFLHLILQNEDRKSCPIDFGNFWEWKVYITHHFLYEIVCSIYVCLTEAQDSSTKNTIYSVLKKYSFWRIVGWCEIQSPLCSCRSKRVEFSRRRANWTRKSMTRINFSKRSVECRMSGNVKEGFSLLQNSEFIYDIIEILQALT